MHSQINKGRLWLLGLVGFLNTACTGLPVVPEAELSGFSSEARQCYDFIRQMERVVTQSGVADAEYHRVTGFPYLRGNRLMAALTPAAANEPQRRAWLEQLRGLDEEARLIEYANLPAKARAKLDSQRPYGQKFRKYLRRCGQQLLQHDLTSPKRRTALNEAVKVPDEYRTVRRVLGLYPLTMFPVAAGVSRWQNETHETYAIPLSELPVVGRLVRYQPARGHSVFTSGEVALKLLRWRQQHPLGLPVPDEESRNALFATFAPIWEIDVAHDDDRIGRRYWHHDGSLRIHRLDPMVYRRLSYTRLGGQWLLQLNYIIWFPARTRSGFFDLYGGKLDGITWRVTLGPDGRPWLYDAIHNCGCYHKLFPGQVLEYQQQQADELWEPSLVPQQAPEWKQGVPLLIRVAHHTHFIERITPLSEPRPFRGEQVPYRWLDYRELRSLKHPKGMRSMFNENGIVPGTERAERWLLWPMGIPNVGAMRQWGHHAIALLGRRHFDDPGLLDGLFRVKSDK